MSYVKGQNYNFNFSDLTLYAIGTIEYRPANNDYVVRVGFTNSAGQYLYFNSYHATFDSAVTNIHFVRDGKTAGKVYNIYGTVSDIHTSPTPKPNTTVVEVLALIYSWENL